MSAPAANARSPPASTIARTSASLSSSTSAPTRAPIRSPESALSRFGRFSRTTATGPSRSTRTLGSSDMYGEFTSLELDRPGDGILRITLRNPKTRNSVDHAAHAQLAAIWQTIDRDDETRVVVVRGADGAFSSGGDLALVEDIA